jgi:hypothetical protein
VAGSNGRFPPRGCPPSSAFTLHFSELLLQRSPNSARGPSSQPSPAPSVPLAAALIGGIRCARYRGVQQALRRVSRVIRTRSREETPDFVEDKVLSPEIGPSAVRRGRKVLCTCTESRVLARTCGDSRRELPGVSARAATASSELFPTDRIRECTDLSLGRFADRRRVQTFVSAVAALSSAPLSA